MITQECTDLTNRQAIAERDVAARRMYEAELAAHDAHQARVEEWIVAAHERLHAAITDYLAADAAVTGS